VSESDNTNSITTISVVNLTNSNVSQRNSTSNNNNIKNVKKSSQQNDLSIRSVSSSNKKLSLAEQIVKRKDLRKKNLEIGEQNKSETLQTTTTQTYSSNDSLTSTNLNTITSMFNRQQKDSLNNTTKSNLIVSIPSEKNNNTIEKKESEEVATVNQVKSDIKMLSNLAILPTKIDNPVIKEQLSNPNSNEEFLHRENQALRNKIEELKSEILVKRTTKIYFFYSLSKRICYY
jgi:hypothetical protein